jgi:hypothetical protein
MPEYTDVRKPPLGMRASAPHGSEINKPHNWQRSNQRVAGILLLIIPTVDFSIPLTSLTSIDNHA